MLEVNERRGRALDTIRQIRTRAATECRSVTSGEQREIDSAVSELNILGGVRGGEVEIRAFDANGELRTVEQSTQEN